MTKKKDNLPVNWQEEMAQHAQKGTEMVKPEASGISLKGGVVSYGGTPVPNNELDVIVLGFIHEHSLYLDKYDPDNPSSPDCFALGDDEDDMIPHTNVDDPQNEDCASCPNLEWGSGSGRGKACQQRYRLICVPADSINSEQTMLSAEVAVLKLPVTSGKIWGQYINTVASMFSRPEWGVITRISAAPDAKTQFKASFECVEGVDFDEDPELYGALRKKIELSQPILHKPYEQSQEEPEPPKKKPRKRGKHSA